MITNIGKNILAKYLIGQAPAYASYIAVGCGASPILSSDAQPVSDIAIKENLDFEMFRVPIISRGYIQDQGVSKIVLTAELPTSDRYEITELGIYSAGTNPSAGAYGSRVVYAFSNNESWQLHAGETISQIPNILVSLGDETTPYDIVQTSPAFFTNADNKTMSNSARIGRNETPRYLNSTLFIAGDSSVLSYDGTQLEPVSGDHVHITGISADYNKNSSDDELRLIFSVINREANSSVSPDSVKILLEFTSADSSQVDAGSWARMEVVVDNVSSTDPTTQKHDFANDRYVLSSVKLNDLHTSSDFSWKNISAVKVYSSVEVGGNPSADFYVALDGLRLENTTSENPLYGMSGYSIVQNQDASPITKFANTANLVEFRFGLGVS
jgi:hypothetical protein